MHFTHFGVKHDMYVTVCDQGLVQVKCQITGTHKAKRKP